MLKKIWHDPVWSKVISAGIIAILVCIGSYLYPWFPTITQWIVFESRVPIWLLLLLSVLAVWKVIDIGRVISTFFKARNKIGNEIHTDLANTTSLTYMPERKTYNTIQQPTYGTQALYQDRSKYTKQTNLSSLSHQAVDAEILGVLSKDGMRRTIAGLQRKTNMKDTVIARSLKRLMERNLIKVDATERTKMERYYINREAETDTQ